MSTPAPDVSNQRFLIVTGSSAGGIDALCSLAASLPSDFSAPIVIAQHLAPTHASLLAGILAGKTELAVVTVTERERLEGGTIYVVGPDHDVEVDEEHATAYAVQRSGPKPSIDRLFTTAAESHGDRVIAIVFSGMGHDGSAGARIVKERGGTVIVQEASSAPYPSMPAISPALIDLVARPEAMGAMLVDFMRGVAYPEAESDQKLLRTMLLQLRERSGIDFTQYKTPTIMRRLSRLMVASGIDSIGDYLRYLQTHPEGYQQLVSAFLIKVTEFFRDGGLFDELRTTIVPGVIADARAAGREVRMWSAGTSTGEEAYSLAMLCAELLREGPAVAVRIFATDLDEGAIAFARRGIYAAESVRQLPPEWVERYFVRSGDSYEITKRIRNMTVFGQHDLGQRAPFPRIDVCLCRNVLIYFTRELQTRALQLFAFSLRDGGYLVLGKSETTGALSEFLAAVDPVLKIYRRQGDRVLVPPNRMRVVSRSPESRSSPDRPASVVASLPTPRGFEGRLRAGETFGAFLSNSPIGVAIVDRHYDVVGLNAAARALLEIHGVGIGEDLIHLARALDGNELRTVIDAAFRNEAPAPCDLAVRDAGGNVAKWVQIVASPDRAPAGERSEMAALVIIDVTHSVRRRIDLEAFATVKDIKIADITRHIDDLESRHRSLLSANDELAAANNELRTFNEQLLIDSEEAASASEEVETLNEEMQATNEELETLNEELQATVEELNTTNEELEARGAELARIAEARESNLTQADSERSALTSAIELVSGPVAVVDGAGTLLYAPTSLGGRVALASLAPNWWLEPTISIDSVRYESTTQRDEESEMTVIALRRLP